MNKKPIILALFMLLLTAVVVLLPVLINHAYASARLDNKIYWQYKAENTNITSMQVAEMYYNNEFAYSGASSQKLSSQRLCSSAYDVLKNVIRDQELLTHCQNIVQTVPNYYTAESRLTLIDNRPMALNFVSVEFSYDDSYLHIYYEEKTKTLIYFEHWINNKSQHENESAEIIDFSQVESVATEYYGKILGLTKEKYSIGRNQYLKGISFGLLRYSEEPIVEFN